MKATSHKVTLEDVARIADVAPATVSRTINSPGLVAAGTRERIQAAISASGYVPNRLAGNLASAHTGLIAAIVPSVTNPVYAETIQSFIAGMETADYHVLLGASGYEAAEEETLITAVLSRMPDAILLTGIQHTISCRRKLLGAGIPIVETWDMTPTPLDLIVGFSHADAGRAVAKYLADKGHQHFAVLSRDDPRAQTRRAAFIGELHERGFGRVISGTLPGEATLESGRKGMAMLLSKGFTQGAVFCSSDIIAAGAATELTARQMHIPEDIALVGFGDQSFAAHTLPALTTVHIACASVGAQAASALIRRLKGEDSGINSTDVGFSIISRASA